MQDDADHERREKTLRLWLLALLRFAVTLDHSDRSAVLAIAAEIDGGGRYPHCEASFGFFRRTSLEACLAITQPSEFGAAVLLRHLNQIQDDRLKRALAAALERPAPQAAPAGKPSFRNDNLWRGLSSRSSDRR